jgi:hypothetical protein
VQVTGKLAELYARALQQPSALGSIPDHAQVPASHALHAWLSQVIVAVVASPESQAVASVVQQLQESQLLQHLGPGMDAAAARLTAAVAALTAATVTTDSSSSSTTSTSSTQHDIIQQQLSCCEIEAECCLIELQNLYMASGTLAPKGTSKLSPALPVAPSLIRLILTTFQSYSKLQQQLQQLQQQEQPGSVKLPKLDTNLKPLRGVARSLAKMVGGSSPEKLLQTYPDAAELLLLPEFASCLAILVVVTALGCGISSDGGAAACEPASTPSSSSSSGGPGIGSSAPGWLPNASWRQQQQAGGGDSSSSSGLRLDSLTPLSYSLLDLLGISKETALHIAGLEKAEGHATLPQLQALAVNYSNLLTYQVSCCQLHCTAQYRPAHCQWYLFTVYMNCSICSGESTSPHQCALRYGMQCSGPSTSQHGHVPSYCRPHGEDMLTTAASLGVPSSTDAECLAFQHHLQESLCPLTLSLFTHSLAAMFTA